MNKRTSSAITPSYCSYAFLSLRSRALLRSLFSFHNWAAKKLKTNYKHTNPYIDQLVDRGLLPLLPPPQQDARLLPSGRCGQSSSSSNAIKTSLNSQRSPFLRNTMHAR